MTKKAPGALPSCKKHIRPGNRPKARPPRMNDMVTIESPVIGLADTNPYEKVS
jgi:hypothetical protein